MPIKCDFYGIGDYVHGEGGSLYFDRISGAMKESEIKSLPSLGSSNTKIDDNTICGRY